jgi:hypothetical protein
LAEGMKICRGREGLEGRKATGFCWGPVGLGEAVRQFGLFVLPGDRGMRAGVLLATSLR